MITPKKELIKPTRRKLISGGLALLLCPPLISAPAILKAHAQLSMTGAGGAFGSGAAALGLQTNLGSFFSLDNTLADATGAVTALTNNNTVTFVSSTPTPIAAVTNSAKFVSASSQSLSHTDATGINVAGIDFSLQVWFYSTGNTMYIASKDTGGFGSREYSIQYTFGTGSLNPTQTIINNSGTANTANVSNNAWHHYVLTYNSSTKAAIVYIDGVSAGTVTAGTNPAGTSTLFIGAEGSGGPVTFWGGNLCLFATWRNRILTPGDVTLLYNSGNGLSYAAML